MWFKNLLSKWTGADKIKEKAAADAEHLVKVAKEAQKTAQEFMNLKNQVEELISKLSQDAEEKKAEIAELEKVKKEEIAKIEAEKERLKLSPKEAATRKKEPWVSIINTHVDINSTTNGFFELDWNEYFIIQLKREGFGADGDREEDIVDRWFREMCATVVVGTGSNSEINAGLLRNELMKDY